MPNKPSPAELRRLSPSLHVSEEYSNPLMEYPLGEPSAYPGKCMSNIVLIDLNVAIVYTCDLDSGL